MILRDALRSLQKDFSKAFFYWLIFVLTTMFIYLFYNIAMSDPSVDPIKNPSSTITYVMILVVILCSVDILFANDFYVKLKGKDLAVRLICGGRFTQIAGFLLAQTMLLLVLAVPLGIFLANCLLPLVNAMMSSVDQSFAVSSHPEAMLNATVILLYVVFWIILLNMSFAYRNAVGLLMNPSSIISASEDSPFGTNLVPKKAKQIFWIAVFLVPILLIYWNRSLAILVSLIGMVGLNGCLSDVISPWINHQVSGRLLKDPDRMAAAGFARRDLRVLKNNIFLFEAGAVILVSMLVNSIGSMAESMTIFISYLVMACLQALALMFKFGTEISGRRRLFLTLNHIGFIQKDQKKIIHQEILYVYGFVIGVTLLYIFNILLSYTLAGDLSAGTSLFLLGGALLPLVICAGLNLLLYRKAVFPKDQEARMHAE
jgi:hypothetical protein